MRRVGWRWWGAVALAGAAAGAAAQLPASASPAASAASGTVLRTPNPAPDSPTSAAVEVRAPASLVFVSGQTPLPAQPDAEKFGPAYWGDTFTQTRSVLGKIDAALKRVGLGAGDVVKMTVFLVAAPGMEGRMDSAGFARAYAEHYGSATQPLRPARSTVQVAALGAPGMLVEIEVIAARR
jgi:enamine deaminase RidA (YjgF/YER057c/UK114 family)